jgi:hypothetical protein
MKKIFKILTSPNFYFPVIDKGKKFIVLDTLDFELDKSYLKIQDIFLKNKTINLRLYAESIWKEISKFIKGKSRYKTCWFVPLKIDFIDNKIIASVDILKAV